MSCIINSFSFFVYSLDNSNIYTHIWTFLKINSGFVCPKCVYALSAHSLWVNQLASKNENGIYNFHEQRFSLSLLNGFVQFLFPDENSEFHFQDQLRFSLFFFLSLSELCHFKKNPGFEKNAWIVFQLDVNLIFFKN